jgi:branched-chain amino acid transport system ATP-binding protein
MTAGPGAAPGPNRKQGHADPLAARRRRKSFGALKVTDNVSFELQARARRLGIIGPNGAGKSTLFNLITGNIRPTPGV